MPLPNGTHLGPYEIIQPIGAGGMGEVYKARDTRLNRIVALKIANQEFSERAEREAQAIAALNHPHICTLYDVGPNYLVMEFLEGRSPRGPMAVDEVLRLAVQIADALDTAHRKGIVHRDLKPGNLLITDRGVKVLDFGLAKITQPVITPGDATLAEPLTRRGSIIGTPAYMSPEQLEGRDADARSDIFSFGLVLYELLSGRRAFDASSQAGMIAAILKDQPPLLTSLQPAIPPALDRTIFKCLAKDPARRWQTASDLRDELRWIADGGLVAPPIATRRSVLPLIGGATLAAAAGAGLATWALRGRNAAGPAGAIRFRLSTPEGAWIERVIERQSVVLAPVGGKLAVIASGDSGPMVWLQRLDSLAPKPLPGTEGAKMVFWSNDGEFIGFWAGGKLKKIAADGGTPFPICEMPEPSSAAWSRDGTILVSILRRNSMLIAVKTGAMTSWKPTFWPRFLPDGKRVLYLDWNLKTTGFSVFVEEISNGRRTPLMPTDTQAVFVSDPIGGSRGFILFCRGGTLLAQRFETNGLHQVGEPIPLAEQVPYFNPTAWSEFHASNDGILVYSAGSRKAQITYFNRKGQEESSFPVEQDFWGSIRLSPNGLKLAVDVFDFRKGGLDIWTYDLQKETGERVTFEGGVEAAPVWSPDGMSLAYGSAQVGPPQLRVKNFGDRGPGDSFPPGPFQLPADWSADGRWIFYRTSGGQLRGEIWVASTSDRKLYPLRQTSFDTSFPQLSPDGQFLAFSASESGRSEVYVQRFDGKDKPKLSGELKRVSQNGGNVPRWRRDGKELFYISLEGDVMAVGARQGSDIAFETPAVLFRIPPSFRSMAAVGMNYDVSHDGQRFYILTRKSAIPGLNVVVNWQAGLGRVGT